MDNAYSHSVTVATGREFKALLFARPHVTVLPYLAFIPTDIRQRSVVAYVRGLSHIRSTPERLAAQVSGGFAALQGHDAVHQRVLDPFGVLDQTRVAAG